MTVFSLFKTCMLFALFCSIRSAVYTMCIGYSAGLHHGTVDEVYYLEQYLAPFFNKTQATKEIN